MINTNRIPALIALIICLEALIYFWAIWTTEAEFIFDKCARNSGRVSSLINLAILLQIGHYGLKKVYHLDSCKEKFRVLITLFTANHLIHFFYVYQNFKSHTMNLSIAENLHGFITFICIIVIPLIIWTSKKLTPLLYTGIILHLFNASYFIMHTFYGKIKPDKPAYHNQLGILVTSLALLYILFRMYKEIREALKK